MTEQLAAVYWPANELAEVMKRWPDGYPGYRGLDRPHEAHRQEVERFLRGFADFGGHATIAVGSADDYEKFAEDCDPAAGKTRAEYATHVAHTVGAMVWPPGRNEPCWCGSARKYKTCCGSPTFL